MKYGEGFWCVQEGRRLPSRVYPSTAGFDYNDGTGDRGEFLLRDFSIDYAPPGGVRCFRMTVRGNPVPLLHYNAFDFDFASIPRLCRAVTCDKADYRIRVASLFHDIGFCVHEALPGLDLEFWNELLFEVMEPYCDTGTGVAARLRMARDRCLREAVLGGVTMGGAFCWGKTDREIEVYRKLFFIAEVPL